MSRAYNTERWSEDWSRCRSCLSTGRQHYRCGRCYPCHVAHVAHVTLFRRGDSVVFCGQFEGKVERTYILDGERVADVQAGVMHLAIPLRSLEAS